MYTAVHQIQQHFCQLISVYEATPRSCGYLVGRVRLFVRAGVAHLLIIQDKLFTRLYKDNIAEKNSDERFEIMSKEYEDEQVGLKVKISELSAAFEVKEQKLVDTSQFLEIVRKCTEITKLTPEIMHEHIECIVVHALDKSIGYRVQQIDITLRFLQLLLTAGSMPKGERLCSNTQPF